MNPEQEARTSRLNTRTFAIRDDRRIYVVVPVLVYEPGEGAMGEGFAQMTELFTPSAVQPFQALEIKGAWCALDPHNSMARDPHQADDITAPPPPMPHQANPAVDGDDPDNA